MLKIAEYSILPGEKSFDDIRAEAIAQLGPEKYVDAVAIAATFNSLDRMANATGIPIEHNKMEMTEGVRAELGLNEMATAKLPEINSEDKNNGPPSDWGPATHEGL